MHEEHPSHFNPEFVGGTDMHHNWEVYDHQNVKKNDAGVLQDVVDYWA